MARTKVAVLIGTLERGGAELDIVRNFPLLNRDEFEVVVLTFGPAGVLAPELESRGIPVISRKIRQPKRAAEVELQEYRTPWWYRIYEKMVLSIPYERRQRIKAQLRRLRGDDEIEVAKASSEGSSEPVMVPVIPLSRRIVRVLLAPLRWLMRIELLKRMRDQLAAIAYMTDVTLWIRHTLKEQHVDIVHSFLPHSYAYGMGAGALMLRRPKQVMSRLSLNFYSESHPVLAWSERTLLHRAVDIVVGNSVLILDELEHEGVAREKLRLLYNGIDPAPFVRAEDARTRAREALELPLDAFVICAVGNLHTYKGHRDLIEACALARDTLPAEWRVIIAGRDQEGNRAKYEELIAERGLSERIALLGECNDVPQVLFAGDVFVQPSHHEGLPNAIIEAMAASLPVIGSTVGGIPEVVRASEDEDATGWLVAPEEPAELASVLVEAASDTARLQRMGERARTRVESEFSLEKSVATYESIYRELCASQAATAIGASQPGGESASR